MYGMCCAPSYPRLLAVLLMHRELHINVLYVGIVLPQQNSVPRKEIAHISAGIGRLIANSHNVNLILMSSAGSNKKREDPEIPPASPHQQLQSCLPYKLRAHISTPHLSALHHHHPAAQGANHQHRDMAEVSGHTLAL